MERVELHFHLLPGVDDGPHDLAGALDLARAAVADGTGLVVCTPHAHMVDVAELPDRVGQLRSALAARGIGALRHRDSPGIQGGYVSNGCVECDELVGRILLDDLLDEHLRNGGTYAQLDTGLAVHLPPPGAEPSLRRSA